MDSVQRSAPEVTFIWTAYSEWYHARYCLGQGPPIFPIQIDLLYTGPVGSLLVIGKLFTSRYRS